MSENGPQADWESLPTAIEEFTPESSWDPPPDANQEFSSETSGESLSQDATAWTDLELPNTEFTQETASESFATEPNAESRLNQSEIKISFQGAGACWWCGGTGVVWSGSENQECPKCGGSGIGPT